MNDVVNTLPNDKHNDKVNLLHESNKVTNVAINTPLGMTERESFSEIVQQGGGWGGILCSNSVDSLHKKSPSPRNNENNTSPITSHLSSPYLYKGIMEIPLLSYIDDLNKVSKCGIESLEDNLHITKKIEMKRLHFNVGDEKKRQSVKDYT